MSEFFRCYLKKTLSHGTRLVFCVGWVLLFGWLVWPFVFFRKDFKYPFKFTFELPPEIWEISLHRDT